MRAFEHLDATSIGDILAAIGEDWQTRLIAGGTDLIPLMKNGVIAPARLINIKSVPELSRLDFSDEGGLVIGALVTLDEVVRYPPVHQHYRVLAEAVEAAGSPQLRNMATLVGNLLQSTRCWYFRGPFFCWLKGGDSCYAVDGENQRHAIFGDGPCHAVHPSDAASALIALDAQLTIYNRDGGSRAVPLEQFYAAPVEERRRETLLQPDELVAEVRVPAPSSAARGTFLKVMTRVAWDFALASVAVQGMWDGPVAREISIVLGGVATVPWRAPQAESVARGEPVDGRIARDAAEAAVIGAQALRLNGYKVELVQTLVERALVTAASPGRQHRHAA